MTLSTSCWRRNQNTKPTAKMVERGKGRGRKTGGETEIERERETTHTHSTRTHRGGLEGQRPRENLSWGRWWGKGRGSRRRGGGQTLAPVGSVQGAQQGLKPHHALLSSTS